MLGVFIRRNLKNMTTQEYIQQNAKGYEGDEFIGKELEKLVKEFEIDQIVETGTYKGATTKRLSEFCHVLTIEVNRNNYLESQANLKGFNAHVTLGSSPERMSEFLPNMTGKNFLFFLDAHWNGTPLIQELDVIANNKLKPVIVIHDWKVPDRPDLGFDSYNGQDYTYDWIKPSLEKIYGENGYSYHYNDKAEGAKRGVIYIYPVKQETNIKPEYTKVSEETITVLVDKNDSTITITDTKPKRKRKK